MVQVAFRIGQYRERNIEVGSVGVELGGVVGERHHDREGVTESVDVIAHGDHVLLARQSSEVTMQYQQQWPTAMIAEPPRAAVVVDEGEVGEQLPLVDDGKRAHARPRIVASMPRSHGVRASIIVTIPPIGGQAYGSMSAEPTRRRHSRPRIAHAAPCCAVRCAADRATRIS